MEVTKKPRFGGMTVANCSSRPAGSKARPVNVVLAECFGGAWDERGRPLRPNESLPVPTNDWLTEGERQEEDRYSSELARAADERAAADRTRAAAREREIGAALARNFPNDFAPSGLRKPAPTSLYRSSRDPLAENGAGLRRVVRLQLQPVSARARPVTYSARDLARLAPSGLAALASSGFVRAPHIALLERKLLDLAAGRIRRLRVATAPRHGKSETVARWFLAWWLMSNPSKRAILVCATAALAESYSRKVRDLVHEHGHIFGAKLRADSRAVERWDLTAGGGLIAAGAGSSIVGRGANLLVANDVVSGFEVAASKAQLEKLVSWFLRNAFTRLEPGAGAVVCGTRWAERDIHGSLEAEERAGGEKWESLILPALSEGEDVDTLRRPTGRALWPARYDEVELARIKSALGSTAFAGLYQQRPVPEGGGLFKREWAKRWRFAAEQDEDSPPFYALDGGETVSGNMFERFLTVDTAVTDSSERNASRSDFTGIGAWGVHAGKLLLLDVDLRRLDGPKIADAIKSMSKRHGGAVAWIEETTMARHLLAYLKAEGVVFKTTKPDRSKLARAIPASALMEQGRIFLPERGEHLGEFEHQVFSFTGGAGGAAHDDGVDILSMAAQVLTETFGALEFTDTAPYREPRTPFDTVALPRPRSW